MSDLSLKILIEEIARVALEDKQTRNRIGHELDVSEEELLRVGAHLNSLLNDDTYDEFGVNTKNSFNTQPKG